MRVKSKLTRKIKKTKDDHKKGKMMEKYMALVTKKMTLSNIGNDIFIDDSAATSRMTNNMTGVYNLTPIRGSVMIGNGVSISCTHKRRIGCHLQAQRWINGSKEMGC